MTKRRQLQWRMASPYPCTPFDVGIEFACRVASVGASLVLAVTAQDARASSSKMVSAFGEYVPTTNSVTTVPSLALAAQTNSLFNPASYPLTADSLVVTGGSIVIDTGDGTNRVPSLVANGIMYEGQVVPNQSSNVWLSLFNFGGLAISNGVSCTVTGNLGLVLGSRGDMTISSTISLNGANGWTGTGGRGGIGGSGGDAGNRVSSYRSSPPDGNHGRGGMIQTDGFGYGGGGRAFAVNGGAFVIVVPAAGGGYGGMGGCFTNYDPYPSIPPPHPEFRGRDYGDSLIVNLYGGSGGGGGYDNYGGGGGGGALELIANDTLTVCSNSTLQVNGGIGGGGTSASGGGSGGGLILAANHLVVAGTLQARGGSGGSSSSGDWFGGGGGGGGRIMLCANMVKTNGMSVSVAGGDPVNTMFSSAGSNGTFSVRGHSDFPYAISGTLLMVE